ncbi:MAG: DUF2207 domain-containing protein [Marinicaulis sp.]|nr:DUF2207 domain-containing protein [Marinicaulis sp.]
MRFIASLFAAFIVVLAPAIAAEQINLFDVNIEVEKDGDIRVTEIINVTVERNEIRRGIYRDLPRYYLKNHKRLPYDYDVKRVRRDGKKEKYTTQEDGNSLRIRIGDADKLLSHGVHEYEIEYHVRNQIRYFTGFDEFYWNATGTYWRFPIAKARASVILPDGARVTTTDGYTGARGSTGKAYEYLIRDGAHIFETTKPLSIREGLTVSLSLEKGAIDPPSAADARAEWWALNGSLVALGGALLGLFGFYFRAFNKYGRDPVKGAIFPQYEPPAGFSPLGVHHVYYRRLKGSKGLIATLIGLATSGYIKIDSEKKKETTFTRMPEENGSRPLFPIEEQLLSDLLPGGGSKTIGGEYDASFTKAYTDFRKFSDKKFGTPYFRWNAIFVVLAVFISFVSIFAAIKMSHGWTQWHSLGVLGLVAVNLVFAYFMPAPTPSGQQIRTHIEGFRLYLKTAEALQLNSVKVGDEAPPPMTTERYEKFLPYAIAIGVEKPWTQHFEKLLPKEAEDYNPHWSSYRGGRYNSLHGLNSAMISSMTSGVSASLPQSSSSSGAGGGGFSGGGGGGGGGGGW